MTVKQAAERLGISVYLVYSLVESKQLAHHRIGSAGRRGKIVIMEKDVAEFLERTKVEAESPTRTPPSPPMIRLKHIKLPPEKKPKR